MTRAMRGLIRSARLGLAPTLVSNALVAWACINWRFPSWGGWVEIAQVVLMGLCFFLYGMWENDRVDARWDARFKPDRPVPKGEIASWTLRQASLIAGVGGLAYSSFLLGQPLAGLMLLAAITVYNWLHKGTGFAIILMGACRGLWAMTAMLAFFAAKNGDMDLFGGGDYQMAHFYIYSLSLYVVTASWVARGEAGHPKRKALAGFLLSSISLHDVVWLAFLSQWGLSGIALACYGLIYLLRFLKQRTT